MTQDTHRSCRLISQSQFVAIQNFAENINCHWGDIFLALSSSELYRRTGASQQTLGLPVMNRLGSVLAKIPCMHMNITALTVDINPQESLAELAQKINTNSKTIRRHQRYRYEDLRRDLKKVGGNNRLFGPVINIMPFESPSHFASIPATVQTLSAGPVEDIAISVTTEAGGKSLRLEIEANAHIYTESFVSDLIDSLLSRLESTLKDPNQAVIPNRELENLHLIHSKQNDSKQVKNFLTLFIDNVAKYPQQTALISEKKTYSYLELLEEVTYQAAFIQEHSPDIASPVAVMIPRSCDTIIAILATLWSGRTFMPIDCMAADKRKKFILEDAGAKLLLYSDDSELALDFIHDLKLKALNINATDKSNLKAIPQLLDPQSTAYIMYTSGSTGIPKGVKISRTSLAYFIDGAQSKYEFQQSDRVLQFAPFHFDACIEEIFLTFSAAATLVLRNDECLESISYFIQFCTEQNISVLDLPTAFWNELVYSLERDESSLPKNIHTVIIGGEAALANKVDSWRAKTNNFVNLWNTYGPTEATVVATAAALSGPKASDYDQHVPIGTPLPHVKALIVNEDLSLTSKGEVGELLIMGPTLAESYINRPQENKSKFIDLPFFKEHGKAYRTGDLVCLNDNAELEYKGRVDFELKISGHRINPLEIEKLLISHEKITNAVVLGVSQNAVKRLEVHIIADENLISKTEIRSFLKDSLAEALIPSSYHYWQDFPITSSGKIDRKALENQAKQEPRPDNKEALNLTEKIILEAWEEVLGISTLRLEQDFFEIGGQSLQCIQVANRLSSKLGKEIPVSTLFRYPICRDLAAVLDTEKQEKSKSELIAPEIEADLKLDPNIKVEDIESDIRTSTASIILLTGATGFVGTHLLQSLLQQSRAIVICLIRAKSIDEAHKRLEHSLKNQGLHFNEEIWKRIEVLPADLAKEKLGLDPKTYQALCDDVDLIYHNAAQVSVVRSYSSLRRINVLSTVELLRLASQKKVKGFHYISTQAVLPSRDDFSEATEVFYDFHSALNDGYQQSKWLSEELCRQASERGIPTSIYRLGRVSGSTKTAMVNEQDLYWSLLKSGLKIKALPLLPVEEIWTPVDYVAESIVALSKAFMGSDKASEIFHIRSEQPVRFIELNDWLSSYGFDFKLLPIPQWVDQLKNIGEEEDQSLVAFFELNKPGSDGQTGPVKTGKILSTNRLNYPVELKVDPELNQSLFYRYLSWAIENKILNTQTLNIKA